MLIKVICRLGVSLIKWGLRIKIDGLTKDRHEAKRCRGLRSE